MPPRFINRRDIMSRFMYVTEAYDMLTPTFEAYEEILDEVSYSTAAVTEGVGDVIKKAWEKIKGFVKWLYNKIVGFLRSIKERIQKFFGKTAAAAASGSGEKKPEENKPVIVKDCNFDYNNGQTKSNIEKTINNTGEAIKVAHDHNVKISSGKTDLDREKMNALLADAINMNKELGNKDGQHEVKFNSAKDFANFFSSVAIPIINKIKDRVGELVKLADESGKINEQLVEKMNTKYKTDAKGLDTLQGLNDDDKNLVLTAKLNRPCIVKLSKIYSSISSRMISDFAKFEKAAGIAHQAMALNPGKGNYTPEEKPATEKQPVALNAGKG